jgi:hypothetical protein
MMASEQGVVKNGLEPAHVDRRGVAGLKQVFPKQTTTK